jgi:hypothetical protein
MTIWNSAQLSSPRDSVALDQVVRATVIGGERVAASEPQT